MAAAPEQAWTTKRIARWLRAYLDWKAELGAGPRSHSVTDYSQPVVMGGGGGGGGHLNYTVNQEELRVRVATVEGWLGTLSQVERQAAEYWVQDEDGTITAVALVTNLTHRQASMLVHCIPLIIWGRFYDSREERETNT